MNTSLTKILTLAAAAALAGFAFTGCMTKGDSDPTLDGGNVVVTQEANNMGVMMNESSSSPKIAVTAADTAIDPVTLEKVIVLRHYDTGCQCFIRTALFTSSVGFERQRLDSIWLDSSGHLLSLFTPAHADSITHIRHVTRINANTGKQVVLTLNTTLVRKPAGDSIVFQWNGTIVGTFNGTAFNSSGFSLMRTYTFLAGFGFPSGTLDIQRGDFKIVIVLGDGVAVCTITDNGKPVRMTYIDIAGTET